MFKRQHNVFRVLVIDPNQAVHHDVKKMLTLKANPNIIENPKNSFPIFKLDSAYHDKDAVQLVKKSIKDDAPFALAFLNISASAELDNIKIMKEIWQFDKTIQIVIFAGNSNAPWELLLREFGNEDNFMLLQKTPDTHTLRQLACVMAKKWENMQMQIMHEKLLQGQLEQTEKEYQHAITHDRVTQLPNRLLLVDRITHAISHSNHAKNIFAVFQINIDRFTIINDTLGREVGDQLLQGLAIRLKALVEEWDATLARLDGDEFVILLDTIRSDEQITVAVQKIHNTIKAPFIIHDQEFCVTACIGIAMFPKDGTDAETLLKHADITLHKAKERGPGSCQFFRSGMTSHNLARLKLENQLRKAIELNQFQLYYQPQFAVNTGEFISVEALVRWRHPEKGIIEPAEFIALIEESGLIVDLGEWILETACKQAITWQQAGLPPFRVAVNIATQQVEQDNFLETVKHVLYKTKLDPQLLEFELTENMIIHHQDTIEKIHALKKMGIKIALDDFGSGYSSISYLKKIPLNRVKIDREYIKNIAINPDDESIIRAIIAIAKNLNLRVLAEGVESREQFEFLMKHECHEVQGIWLGKALPPEKLPDALRKAKLKIAGLLAAVKK